MSTRLSEVTNAAEKVSRLSPQGLNNLIMVIMTSAVVAFAAWQSFLHVPNLIESHQESMNTIVKEHKETMDSFIQQLDNINQNLIRLNDEVRDVKRDVKDIRVINER